MADFGLIGLAGMSPLTSADGSDGTECIPFHFMLTTAHSQHRRSWWVFQSSLTQDSQSQPLTVPSPKSTISWTMKPKV